MAKKSKWVEIGKRKLELSNLNKELYPDDGILKAEVIRYYLDIAPTILKHIKNRPLTLVRFPDGIYEETFYQKNRPDWAPDWIEYITLGSEEKKDYIIATEPASLVWLANLACLELHQLHCKKSHSGKPDYIVYDLDPPEDYDFTDIVDIAFELKEHIESYGYHVFVKTTGGKGVHLVTPVDPKWDFHTVFEAAQSVAKPFVDKNKRRVTLHIKKESRKGRVLIDIYRNRQSQSIIAPYSLRGRQGAPVSMPLPWDQLAEVSDPNIFNLSSVVDHVLDKGDPWEAMPAYSVPIHTKRKQKSKKNNNPGPSDRYKSPEQLKEYAKKRDFKKTPEPDTAIKTGDNNTFVVHRHHASRLHYDLRLEMDGTLKSWAVPRGMPPRPGIKRLAVATEDHPMEYLTFEGKIPKGQYGGGDMWIYALGKYEIIKEKKNGYYFNLYSDQLTAEYRIYQTKEKEYLLERLDEPQIDYLNDIVHPMLAYSRRDVPPGDYIYEVKWDGIRASVVLDEGQMTIRSRNQKDITHLFPELAVPEKAFRANNGLFDTEIVCLDNQGKPNFKQVVTRLHHTHEGKIEHASKRHPAHCYVFDCLYLDGRPLINEPLMRRRTWLGDTIKKDNPFRFSEAVEEGRELFEAAGKMKLEGIMAKERNGRYHPGKRSTTWYKVKIRNTTDCVILGYTQGKGDRSPYFGALQIGEYENGTLKYRGKVGTGYDQKAMKNIFEQLKKIDTIKKPIKAKPLDEANTTWLNPELFCEIEYASITDNDTYREPVFLRLRPDLAL